MKRGKETASKQETWDRLVFTKQAKRNEGFWQAAVAQGGSSTGMEGIRRLDGIQRTEGTPCGVPVLEGARGGDERQ